MALGDLTSKTAVSRAIQEFESLGRDRFLAKYGFGHARAYFLVHRVAFVSLHEQLDCTTPTGQLLFHLLGAFAEFERAIIRERVRAGLLHAKARTSWSG